MTCQLIPSHRQRHWKLPAVLNFFLGGVGAGFILLNILFVAIGGGTAALYKVIPYQVPALLVIGFGMTTLMAEAGRPANGLHLLRGIAHSWISREIIFYFLLFCFCLLDIVNPGPFPKLMTVICAISLMLSHGFIVYRSRAVAAWHSWPVPVHFLASGLANGYGVLLLMHAGRETVPRYPFNAIGIGLILVSLVSWLVYLRQTAECDDTRTAEGLFAPFSVVIAIVLGNILPVLMMALSFLPAPAALHSIWSPFLQVGSGVFLLVGGLYVKFGIIMIAGTFRAVRI